MGTSGRCKRGHALEAGNVYVDRAGGRHCRRCAIARAKARYRRLASTRVRRMSHAAVRSSYPLILELWLRGLLIREIADELGVSPGVVAGRMSTMRESGWELPERSRGRRPLSKAVAA